MENFGEKYFIDNVQKYSSMVLLFCISILALSYVYFINSSVLNTVTREQNNKEISQMIARISSLENSYINLKSNINIDMAYTLGFRDDFSRVHFSSENTNVAGNISLRGNEI